MGKAKEIEVNFSSEFRQFLENGSIEKAIIQERVLHGTLKYEESLLRNGKLVTFTKFKTILPPTIDSDMMKW